jgi:hypothetical protein
MISGQEPERPDPQWHFVHKRHGEFMTNADLVVLEFKS